ncbi:MAG: hypothetical protein SGPRY_009355, partial [Prymnesium sp.]
MAASGTLNLHTNSRTNHFCVRLCATVLPRLSQSLLAAMEETKPHTAVCGLHPNWRVARYEVGQLFCAHFDQADSLTLRDESTPELKRRYYSHHTLLISLSDRAHFEGGATRLFLPEWA